MPGLSASNVPAGDGRTLPESPAVGLNNVLLVGRVSGDPVETDLPSGDAVVAIRLVVPRAGKDRKPPYVDTIDCSAWTSRLRRSVLRWLDGDVVSLEGALRRRFWRGNQGPQSRYEVEITKAHRVGRSPS